MPQETIDALLITQFSDMMHVKAQQLRARLRPYVKIKKMVGDVFAYDGLGTVEARELSSRFSATQFDEIEHFRRKITKRRFSVTLPVDKNDLEGMLTDPQGQYAEEAVHAMERIFDKVCYDAMFADVYTGRDFGTTVSFANDGGLTVTATGGLTLAKILEIKKNFMDNEVGNDVPVNIVLGISGDEHTTLIQIDQFINTRYTSEMALQDGIITKVCGMDLVAFGDSSTRPLLSVSGGVRNCFALATGGLCVGMAREWEISIKDRPDYVDTKQIQITGVLGAVRTDGDLIQKLTTTDL